MVFSTLLSPHRMHIPDGFLSIHVALLLWAVSAAFLALALRQSRKTLGERQVPLMGIMAAFIFAAQMFNFPIPGGTSGHLLGGVLAAILLGPWGGMLTMTAVIMVQGILFQDGGLVSMGANLFNMGILTTLIGTAIYRLGAHRSQRVKMLLAGGAAWLSVVGAALAASLELWLSGTVALAVVVPAMVGVHAVIGIGEAIITVAALSFVQRTRPDLLEDTAPQPVARGWIAAGLLLSLGVILLAPLASTNPDGLERVAHNLGFLNREAPPPVHLLSDYTLPWLSHTPWSTILAGVIGVAVVTALAFGIAKALRRTA